MEKSKESSKQEHDAAQSAVGNDEQDVDVSEVFRRLRLAQAEEAEQKHEKLFTEFTLAGVAKYILNSNVKHIITMAGAGISTSAGIPDFRSPGTGLYDNLQKYKLPTPQSLFEIEFFKSHPEPFFDLARELFPGKFKPTPCHYFLQLLASKGLLLRHYTQNIDTLERVAGLPGEKIVEAHGTFHTSHCLACRHEYSFDWMKEKVFSTEIPHCENKECKGLVKPDIVFFGEALPSRFFECVEQDFEQCDLLIVMGTSLVVQPFASLVDRVPDKTPRLYINMEKAQAPSDPIMRMLGMGSSFRFDEANNYRDVFHQGSCDDGCQLLADELGFGKELKLLVAREHEKVDAAAKNSSSASAKSTKL